jgi:hypothetical protein
VETLLLSWLIIVLCISGVSAATWAREMMQTGLNGDSEASQGIGLECRRSFVGYNIASGETAKLAEEQLWPIS